MKTLFIATSFAGFMLAAVGGYFVVEQTQHPAQPTPPLVMQGKPEDHDRENREAFAPRYASEGEDLKVDWRAGW